LTRHLRLQVLRQFAPHDHRHRIVRKLLQDLTIMPGSALNVAVLEAIRRTSARSASCCLSSILFLVFDGVEAMAVGVLGERELHSLVFTVGAKAAFQSRRRRAGDWRPIDRG
jgi:hypothetical protein